jgi:DNA invertase Pin-like site-specific DNA recombinase
MIQERDKTMKVKNYSKTVGYVRTCCGTIGLDEQNKKINAHARAHDLEIDSFISVGPVSGNAPHQERQIDSLLKMLNSGDILIATDPFRIGRTLGDVAEILKQLEVKGVKVMWADINAVTTEN